MPLFGQILAALYQEDIVEEDDIRGWHILPSTSGEGRKEGVETENFRKCWTIGTLMIQQFDDQDSDSDNEAEKPMAVTASTPTVMAIKNNSFDGSDSDEASSDVPEGGEEESSTTTASTNTSDDESEETSD